MLSASGLLVAYSVDVLLVALPLSYCGSNVYRYIRKTNSSKNASRFTAARTTIH